MGAGGGEAGREHRRIPLKDRANQYQQQPGGLKASPQSLLPSVGRSEGRCHGEGGGPGAQGPRRRPQGGSGGWGGRQLPPGDLVTQRVRGSPSWDLRIPALAETVETSSESSLPMLQARTLRPTREKDLPEVTWHG